MKQKNEVMSIKFFKMHKIQRRPFTQNENMVIFQSVKLIGEEWEIIAKMLPGRTPKQIQDRYKNYLREDLKKEPFSDEEDQKIIELFKQIGPKWTKMTSQLPGRSGNDIKNRWHKHIIKKNHDLLENKSNETLYSENDAQYIMKNDIKSNCQKSDDEIDLDDFSLYPPNVNEDPVQIDEVFDEGLNFLFL